MKRIIALLLLLCLFSGCASPAAVPSETLPAEIITAPTADTDEPSTESAVTGPGILDGKEPAADSENLFYIKNPALEKLTGCREVLIFRDCLLIVRNTEMHIDGDPTRFQILLVDLNSGELRCKKDFQTEDTMSLRVCGDQIAITDWAESAVIFLDDTLKEIGKRHFKPDSSGFFTDSKGEYAWFLDQDCLKRMHLSSGKTETVRSGLTYLRSLYSHGSTLNLTYLDPDTLWDRHLSVDMDTGNIRTPPENRSYSYVECIGDFWFSRLERERNVYMLGTQDHFRILESENASFSLLEGPAPLFNISFETDTVSQSVYRQDGSFVSSCVYPTDMGYSSQPVWCEGKNGYFFTVTGSDDASSVIFWDPAIPSRGKDLSLTPCADFEPEPPAEILPRELYDRAAEISRRFGVHILLGDQCGTEYTDFYAEQETDPETVSHGLDVLETALSSYPEGFFPQLLYGNFREVEINLTGGLTYTRVPDDAEGDTAFAGFVTHTEGKHVMVLNILLSGLEQTIYHEFSHIIDVKLEHRSQNRGGLYSEEKWKALNPEGFTYSENLLEVPGSSCNPDYNAYFIDLYARTFPTEDRARVLEYAMAGFDGYFYGPLREKLAYYSEAIRDGFNTDGWPETTRWEKPLRAASRR